MTMHSATNANAPRDAIGSAGRRKPATAVALSLATLVVAAGVPTLAYACFADPSTGKCVAPPPTAHPYQVTGADSQGLAVQALPHIGNVLRWAHNGTTLNVVCQVNNGDQADGRTQYGRPFRTWDQLNDGTFVYDWYMNTPTVATDGYSPGMAHCPTSNPIPPGGGPGTYQVTGTDSAGLAVHSLPQLGGVLRSVPNGTSLTVSCQINDGAQVDGRTQNGHPFTTWDQLSDGTWVYDWYMTTPLVGGDGFSPGMPHCQAGSVIATPDGPTVIDIGWTDSTDGNATYLVTNVANRSDVRSAGRGATGLSWDGVPQATRVCFQVASVLNGYQSPWSTQACTTTPSWCPVDDTHPVCSDTGAFQADCADPPTCTQNPTCSVTDADYLTETEAVAAVDTLGQLGLSHAAEFLSQYLGATGLDLSFDAAEAYQEDAGFKGAIDATAADWIKKQLARDTAFDTGYQVFPTSVDGNAYAWSSDDWKYAVARSYYRLVGTRQANGTWSVGLQLTSYYQYRIGDNFLDGLVNGELFNHLACIGWAQNFREVGKGTLAYSASGNPL